MGKRPSNDEGKTLLQAGAPERRLSGGPGGASVHPAGEEWRRDYREGERVAGAAPAVAAAASGDVPPAAWRGEGRSFGPIEVVERDYALAAELIDSELYIRHGHVS